MTNNSKTTALPKDEPLNRLCKLLRVVPHGKYGQALNRELQAAFAAGYAATTNDWKETVRDIYDEAHLGNPGLFKKGAAASLARKIISLIEDRHPAYFGKIRP